MIPASPTEHPSGDETPLPNGEDASAELVSDTERMPASETVAVAGPVPAGELDLEIELQRWRAQLFWFEDRVGYEEDGIRAQRTRFQADEPDPELAQRQQLALAALRWANDAHEARLRVDGLSCSMATRLFSAQRSWIRENVTPLRSTLSQLSLITNLFDRQFECFAETPNQRAVRECRMIGQRAHRVVERIKRNLELLRSFQADPKSCPESIVEQARQLTAVVDAVANLLRDVPRLDRCVEGLAEVASQEWDGSDPTLISPLVEHATRASAEAASRIEVVARTLGQQMDEIRSILTALSPIAVDAKRNLDAYHTAAKRYQAIQAQPLFG